MNIFVLSRDPVEAAQMMKRGHLIKMPLESAQMLCTALWSKSINAPYKPAYLKHPCNLWVQKSTSNFYWLVDHALELCRLYTLVYEKQHASETVINECKNLLPFNNDRITPYAQAMPEKYKHTDSVTAYRSYYYHEKVDILPKGYPKFIPKYNLVKEYQ